MYWPLFSRILEFVLCLLAILLFLLVILSLLKSAFFHKNLRCILITLSLFVICMNSLILSMLISGFIRGGGIRHDLSNPLILNLTSSQQFELFCFNLSSRFGYLYWIAFSAISFERALATYFVQDYEKRFTSWLSQTMFVLGMFLFYGFDLLIEHFISTFALIIFSLSFHMIFNFVAIGMIHRINLKYVDINSSLSKKFTAAENVKMTQMIFPVFILWLTSQWILFGLLIYSWTSTNQIFDFNSVFFTISAIFTALVPFFLLRTPVVSAPLLTLPCIGQFVRLFAKIEQRREVSVPPSEVTATYFNNYSSQWKSNE